MAEPVDHLARIVQRKRLEVARRAQHAARFAAFAAEVPSPPPGFVAQLRRPSGSLPRVIAEIKTRSPSAGLIRARVPGELVDIARGYEQGGAAAISVLCDGPGFGGCALDLRRVTRAVHVPVLFKEFVVDEVQLDLARALGASFVLLLVRVLDDAALARLIRGVRARGMEPIVEAADAAELARAVQSEATVLGINARDLRSFQVDPAEARGLVDQIPIERIAVFMSGIRTREDIARVAETRADAVLVGEGLMRAADPGQRLAELLA